MGEGTNRLRKGREGQEGEEGRREAKRRKKHVRKAFQQTPFLLPPSMLPASAGGVSRQGHHPALCAHSPSKAAASGPSAPSCYSLLMHMFSWSSPVLPGCKDISSYQSQGCTLPEQSCFQA